MPTQTLKFDFNQIARLKEAKHHLNQPAYDERFYPARINYELYGRVLEAKYIQLHGNTECVHETREVINTERQKGIWNFIKWLAA